MTGDWRPPPRWIAGAVATPIPRPCACCSGQGLDTPDPCRLSSLPFTHQAREITHFACTIHLLTNTHTFSHTRTHTWSLFMDMTNNVTSFSFPLSSAITITVGTGFKAHFVFGAFSLARIYFKFWKIPNKRLFNYGREKIINNQISAHKFPWNSSIVKK